MPAQAHDLWSLVLDRQQLDPEDLAAAIEQQASEEVLDYRTRLLIKESVAALGKFWGNSRFARWLNHSSSKSRIGNICAEEFDEVGFPSLGRRLMDKTRPEHIRQFFEHIGSQLRDPVRIDVAGSGALILAGYLDRHTEAVDIVGDVPAALRNDHPLLAELSQSYNLHVGHVQTHYFPAGWEDRVHSQGLFGRLQVRLVDVYDVFLSKLFSARLKDNEDLRQLAPQLEKSRIESRLLEHCQGFLATPRLLEIARGNWQILFGEPLPQ